ncbi:T9SS type A sorting domain-containing protein [candidate division WOR-3 bacterium]|nr:T9SS type A sorting domain-containing protein [candidate division WOR-3 bacterium]
MKRPVLIFFSLLLVLTTSSVYGKMRDEYNAMANPYTQFRGMEQSNIWLCFTNYGFFGNGGEYGIVGYSCMFPAYSNQEYLFQGALWIAAVTGRDTLCSVGVDGWAHEGEMYPGTTADDSIHQRSTIPTSPVYDSLAVSELDFVSVYYDTYTDPSIPSMGPWHKPLGLQVTMESFSWSYEYAEDFIIINFWIKNIGRKNLKQCYLGLYVDADVGPVGAAYDDKAQDDVCGFIPSIPVQYGGNPENPKDSINVAWIANAGLLGFPQAGTAQGVPTPDVTGTRVLRTPHPNLTTSFNWWYSNQNDQILDWGPCYPDNTFDIIMKLVNSQLAPGDPQPGTPSYDDPRADILKWLYLGNGSFDPDQLDIKYENRDTLFNDTRYLLSFGPIYPALRNGVPVTDSMFLPGDSVPVTFAYIGGEDFQKYSNAPLWSQHPNATDTIVPRELSWSPIRYDFTDLGVNARWALDVYDNPNVITETKNGPHVVTHDRWPSIISGDTIFCDTLDPFFHWPYPLIVAGDTIDWSGDGIPDYAGPPPPAFTEMLVVPGVPRPNDVAILWGRRNKTPTDTTQDSLWNVLPDEQVGKDIFAPNYEDFQGYRVYRSYPNNEREIAGWTLLKQWDRGYRWIHAIPTDPNSDTLRVPTDPAFAYGFWLDRDSLRAPDADLADTVLQLKYQLAHDPSFSPLRQYENTYRYIYVDSGVTILSPVYYTVTCFDFGNPQTGVAPLETSKGSNTQRVIPGPAPQPLNDEKPVMVIPNPYRGDIDYSSATTGHPWEDPSRRGWTEHSRRISFINLPEKCTIRIYTLSGELVKTLVHEDMFSSVHDWDLISSDIQLIASGIYLFSVEDESGKTQVGKFVVLK